MEAEFIANRLRLSGLYTNKHHAIAAMGKWPDLPVGKSIQFKTRLKVETALKVYDWCVDRKLDEAAF